MFTINGIDWDLRLVRPNSRLLQRSDGTLTLGVTDGNTNTVYINNNLSDYRFTHVLCHEIVHCIMFSYDIDIDIQTEEFMADFIATYGFEIIDLVEKIITVILQKKTLQIKNYVNTKMTFVLTKSKKKSFIYNENADFLYYKK